jgi:beta-galactosidase GanA
MLAVVLAGCGNGGGTAGSPSPLPTSTHRGGAAISAFTGGNPATVIATLDKSPVRIAVVSWIFAWSAIEPAENTFVWSKIDAAIAAAAASGRKSYLRVIPGQRTPLWVYADGALAMSIPGTCFQGVPNHFGTVTMPATWEATYIAKWTGFIKAMGSRYNANPNLFAVSIGGGGYAGEMTLPHCPSVLQQFGYSDAAILAAWEQFESAGRKAFPNQATTLAIDEPMGIGKGNVLPPLLDYVRANFGSHLWIQQNGLRATTSPNNTYVQMLLTASTYTKVGWQMWFGDNTPDKLRPAFAIAVRTHASYVEVYLNDITNPTDAQPLKDLATGNVSG